MAFSFSCCLAWSAPSLPLPIAGSIFLSVCNIRTLQLLAFASCFHTHMLILSLPCSDADWLFHGNVFFSILPLSFPLFLFVFSQCRVQHWWVAIVSVCSKVSFAHEAFPSPTMVSCGPTADLFFLWLCFFLFSLTNLWIAGGLRLLSFAFLLHLLMLLPLPPTPPLRPFTPPPLRSVALWPGLAPEL